MKNKLFNFTKDLKELVSSYFLPDFTEDEEFEEESEESDLEMEMDLEPIKEVFEDYIGVIIVGFERFQRNVPNLEANIVKKMIVEVQSSEKEILLKLVNINDNSDGGVIILTPNITGEVEELENDVEPDDTAVFRFVFYGGNAIDYLDVEEGYEVIYLHKFKGSLS